jgi:putative intracellular protease/amidase
MDSFDLRRSTSRQSRHLPPADVDAALAEAQKQAFVDALQPRHPGKPLIAILAINDKTEMTDLLVPHAILQSSAVAEVHPIAPRSGLVRLFPTFRVEVAEDFASFDRAHPAGADYVIVPAMRPDDNRSAITWLRRQAAKGTRVIGVC